MTSSFHPVFSNLLEKRIQKRGFARGPKKAPQSLPRLSQDQPARISLLRTLLSASTHVSGSGRNLWPWHVLKAACPGQRGGRRCGVFVSIMADFPNEEPNSSPLVSLCLWIKKKYVSSCDREGPWFWRENAGVVPALELLRYPCVPKEGYIFGYILILAGSSHSLSDSSVWLTKWKQIYPL